MERPVGLSSNGRTADSDSVSLGSSPGSPAKPHKSSKTMTFSFIYKYLYWFELKFSKMLIF